MRSEIIVSVSPQTSNLLGKYKRAATAAFLLVLLVAVLPFFFSSDISYPAPVHASPSVVSGNNGVYASAEQTTPTQFYSNMSANGTEGPLPTNVMAPVRTAVALNVQPTRLGLGSPVSLKVTVSPSPPTAEDVFGNLTVFVLRPDGTVDLLGPFQTDQNGFFSASYTPGMIGGYKIHANCPGQFFSSRNMTYLAAESSEIELAVLSEAPPSQRANRCCGHELW